MQRLITGKFVSPTTTRGLELATAEFDHPSIDGAKMRLNLWDFGGQIDYRPAQQLLFSESALYLLLWHARHDPAQDSLEDWLRLLTDVVGRDARVIIVATNIDQGTPTDQVERLTKGFSDIIVGFHSVDSESGNGVAELLGMIKQEVLNLKGFGSERPKAWIAARDIILDLVASGRRYPLRNFRKHRFARA